MKWYYPVRVYDEKTGQPIEGIEVNWPADSIMNMDGSQAETQTNSKGESTIETDEGAPDSIVISAGGMDANGVEYETKRFEVMKTPNYDMFTEVYLRPVDDGHNDNPGNNNPGTNPGNNNPGNNNQPVVDNDKDEKKSKKIMKYIFIGAAIVVIALIAMIIW